MNHASRFYFIIALLLTFFVTGTTPALAKEGAPLALMAQIAGQRQITIDPYKYPAEVLTDYFSLEPSLKTQFLKLREEKLSTVLKSLKGRLLEEPDPELRDGGWFAKQATKLIKTIDILLFKNCKLLTSPAAEVGTLYTAQAVLYWGMGQKVKSIGIELSLLHHRHADGETQTTLSLDRIEVVRALLPVPIASAGMRVIRFNSLSGGDEPLESVTIDHLPFGPVTSKGNNHLGLGFAGSAALPPFPFSTFTGFSTKTAKQKILWTCKNLLTR